MRGLRHANIYPLPRCKRALRLCITSPSDCATPDQGHLFRRLLAGPRHAQTHAQAALGEGALHAVGAERVQGHAGAHDVTQSRADAVFGVMH